MEISAAIDQSLPNCSGLIIHTLIPGKDKEIGMHESTTEVLKASFYITHVYLSSEQSTNDSTNGTHYAKLSKVM